MSNTLKIGLAALAIALLVGVFSMMSGDNEPAGLFETADSRIDTVDPSLGGEPTPAPTDAELERIREKVAKELEGKHARAAAEATPRAVPGDAQKKGYLAPMDALSADSFDFDLGDAGSVMGGSSGGSSARVRAGRRDWSGITTKSAEAPRPKKSGYLSSDYLGGSGQLDRMAELVDEGIVLDGKTVKLSALTASYHQPIAVPAGQALVAFANPEHTRISTAGGTTHLQIGIQAANRELPQRPPVQLVLVVDTSGSMDQQGKMGYAKDAARQLVDKLLPTDQLAIVTYDSFATVSLPLQPRGDGAAAQAAIQQIVAGGSTNISGALESAYELLGPKRDKDAISRVVLLSDGNPTAGVTDPSAIRRLSYDAFQEGLQTTTIGVGLDFNSQLMMDVARDGKGNYHFVRDGDAIARVLDEELDQLTHVVAQAVRLRIQLPEEIGLVRVLGADVLDESAAKEVRGEERRMDKRIAEELGIAENRQDDSDEGLKLVVPSFHMGKHHIVMLEIEVPAGADPVDVAKVEVKYKDLLVRQNAEQNITARVERAASKADSIASLDSKVKKNLLGFQTGEAMLRAGQFVERGFIDAAVKEIDDQMALLGVAADRWRDNDLERDVELLGAYKEVIQAQTGGGLGPQARSYLSNCLSYNGWKLTR